jgi:hypothetical protein
MRSTNYSAIALSVILIGLGLTFLVFNFIPGFTISRAWPIILIIVAIGFFLPPVAWPAARRSLSAFFIPGCILLILGVLFLYNTLTRDWTTWAYVWMLIPAGVGLGLALASHFGAWGKASTQVGIWMLLISVAVFSLFTTLLGTSVLKIVGAFLLIAAGLYIFFKSFRREDTTTGEAQ